jgi:hypothetical protein
VSYLYETHLHTSRSSACGVSGGPEYIRYYKDRGYAGIIVTDHFYNGNTAIARNLPWREWVNRFCRGYEEAWEEGDRQGLDVFFGWEETFDSCDDYLVYGLDKAWLLEHPECRNWTRKEQFLGARAAGGCVVQAHPFRQHSYISRVILSSGCVDAVEAANGGNHEPSYDALAMRYAQGLGLPVTAGSDIHGIRQLREGEIFGVYLDEKIRETGGFAAAIRNRTIAGLHISPGRCDFHGDEKVLLPVDIRDSNDRITGKSWKKVIRMDVEPT